MLVSKSNFRTLILFHQSALHIIKLLTVKTHNNDLYNNSLGDNRHII